MCKSIKSWVRKPQVINKKTSAVTLIFNVGGRNISINSVIFWLTAKTNIWFELHRLQYIGFANRVGVWQIYPCLLNCQERDVAHDAMVRRIDTS